VYLKPAGSITLQVTFDMITPTSTSRDEAFSSFAAVGSAIGKRSSDKSL
jgi:hypothetical protein